MTAVITREGNGFRLQLGVDERDVVVRLLHELRELLEQSVAGERTATSAAEAALLHRLFPVVHPDDREAEAEYQHLMRGELVTSRLAAIDTVVDALQAAEPPRRRHRQVTSRLTEGEVLTFMQAVNGLRLVLGTMLDVSEDDEPPVDDTELAAEHHLYAYLSWVLDSTVMALNEG